MPEPTTAPAQDQIQVDGGATIDYLLGRVADLERSLATQVGAYAHLQAQHAALSEAVDAWREEGQEDEA